MKRSLFFMTLIGFAFLAGSASGQAKHNNIRKVVCPDNVETTVCKAVYFDVSPPLLEMAKSSARVAKRKENRQVENAVNPRYSAKGYVPFMISEDPVRQKQDGTYRPLTGPVQNFEGTGNMDDVMPPDTQGDVSLDNYIQVINMRYAIWSKTGTVVLAGTPLSTIWAGIPAPYNGRNDGDPVVVYDQVANRWVISQFALPSGAYAELIAISQTSDPTGSWYRYVFQFGNQLPDYPKLGIWPDGYYLTFNQFQGGYTQNGVGACALERAKMLTGDPNAQMVYKNLTSSADPWSMLPSDWDGTNTPPSGDPNYFMYFNDWSNPSAPDLRIWSYHVDWTTPANSTFDLTTTLVPATFSSYFCSASRGRCIPQPGTSLKLESLSDRLMYRLQYRNFGGYQTLVACHTVNSDGAGLAGCRWYELRNTGSGWGIYQQGTYAPDNTDRWMPSIAMNGSGDIALGFSLSDASTVYPSIHYTGRRSSDPLGQMTVAEQTIINGTGSQTYSAYGRWGDYSMMSVDPTDDLTFWYTNEYVQTTGGWTWQTRVASFLFSNNPSVATTAATGVTTSAATLNGTINPNGLASTYHFEWGTTISYGNNTPTVSAGSGSGTLSVSAGISSLTGGTTYHCRIVGVNSDGTTNGNDITFTPGAAVVTTSAASSITLTSATSGGNVVSDGGGSVTARGVCWGTTANPTTAGNHTTDGSGLGTFTSSLSGLTSSTLYHTRAYATNSFGTWYGADVTFTTLCGIYTLPFTESFSSTSMPSCWTQVDHQGNGQVWQFGVITTSGGPNLTGNYAFLNSDGYGSGSSQNADLISPVMNCSTFSNVTLQFNHYYDAYSGQTGTLSYSIDGGTTWTTIQTFTTSTSNPAAFSQVIPGAAQQASVKFRWNFTGSWGWWWGIDDISVTGTITNTLAVTPANQNVPQSPAGSTTFNVTSNTTWNASSNQSWCTVTPSGTGNGTITANYSVNTGVGNRVANITVTATGASTQNVTVTQAGIPATLNVTPANQDVPYTPAGSTSFNVTSNTGWTVASDQTWCTVTPSGSGNGTITANYPVYTGITSRVANVTVTVTGLPPVIVTVTQAASPGTLTVTPSNLNVSFLSGMVDFAVASNASWTTVSDASWCTVTPSGTGNGTLVATYTENTALTPRVASITVTATGISPVTVTVSQEAAVGTLTVAPSNQNVSYLAGATTFTVLSNTSWTATSDSAWLTIDPSGGTGNGTITATFLENPYHVSRVATITVTVAGIPAQAVTVTQAQSTVSVSELNSEGIRIIPNPSKGTFRIDAGKLKYESMNVTIMDISGRTIMHKVCWERPDLNFDLSASPEGSYFVKISFENQEVIKKLIITNK